MSSEPASGASIVTADANEAAREAQQAGAPTSAPLPESTKIEVRRRFFFFKEIPSDFRLQQPDRKLYTTADATRRAAIETEMDHFLSKSWTAEELFPETESKFVLAIPKRYTTTRGNDINRMFPNTDTDARTLLDVYTSIFRYNFFTRIYFRRAAQLISAAIMFLSGSLAAKYLSVHEMSSQSETSPLQWGLAAFVYTICYLIGWAAYGLMNWVISGLATPPREHSAQALSQNMLERFQALGNCLNEIVVAERDYFNSQEKVWVRESNYLTSLLVWLPMRSYHLENYFQIKMARIRTIMWAGQVLALVLGVLIWYGGWRLAVGLSPDLFLGGNAGLAVFVIATFVWSIHSALSGATGLDAIRRLITIDKWQTLGRIKMHSQISDVFAFLIRKFIMLRDTGRDIR